MDEVLRVKTLINQGFLANRNTVTRNTQYTHILRYNDPDIHKKSPLLLSMYKNMLLCYGKQKALLP